MEMRERKEKKKKKLDSVNASVAHGWVRILGERDYQIMVLYYLCIYICEYIERKQ